MSVSSGLSGPGAGGGGAAGLAAAQAAQAAAREQATGLGAGLGTLAAVVAAGLLYLYWRRRGDAQDALAKALSSSAEKGNGGGSGAGAGGAAAQAGKFNMLNPFVKGAKERTLREHGEGKRVGRTAWSPGQAQDQEEAQPASPQGTEAAGLAASRGGSTVRSAALAVSYTDPSPSPQAPSAQQVESPVEEGAAVGVSVRELADGEGEGSGEGREGDVEQTLQSSPASAAFAATVAVAAASPPPLSPPGLLTARAALGPAPGAASRLAAAAAASDVKQGLQPIEVAGSSREGGGANERSPVSAQPALGSASSHFSFLPLPPPLPPGRGGGARARGTAAGLNLAVPPPLPAQAAPLARGMAWATDNPMLRRTGGER